MTVLVTALVVVGVLALVGLSLSLRIVKQYELGVVFRLGRVVAVKPPGLVRIVPVIDVIRRVSMRVGTFLAQETSAVAARRASAGLRGA